MRKPSGIYNGDTDGIMRNYRETIDDLPIVCDSIERIVDYLNFKLTRRGGGGLSDAEGQVLDYAESKLKQNGGGRISKKRPTARRLRSSKARKARKARATRRK